MSAAILMCVLFVDKAVDNALRTTKTILVATNIATLFFVWRNTDLINRWLKFVSNIYSCSIPKH